MKTEGECVPLEYESCSPEHHFTFEATPKNVFLASVQSYSALCTRWLYLLNCALKANLISQGRHLLGSQTPPHIDISFRNKGKVWFFVNATHCHNCTAAKNETLSKDSASLVFNLLSCTHTYELEIWFTMLQTNTLPLPQRFSTVGLNARTLDSG